MSRSICRTPHFSYQFHKDEVGHRYRDDANQLDHVRGRYGFHELRFRQEDPNSFVVRLLLHSLDGARRRHAGLGVVVDPGKDFAEGPVPQLVAQCYLWW